MLKKVVALFMTFIVIFVPLFNSVLVKAAITACDVNLSPSSLSPGGASDITFNINNFSLSDINWVQITSPSTNYTIIGGNGAGWSQVSNSDTEVTYSSGTIAANSSGSVSIRVNTDINNHLAEVWTLQVSDSSGTNPFTCTGSPTTEISGPVIDTLPPTINNISVQPISSTSMSILWLTDEPATSVIDYGQDENYGEHLESNALTITHNLVLTNLSSNTSYHYQVSSADAAPNSTSSGDNTFLTVDVLPTITPSITITGKTTIPILKTPKESIPPTIIITTPPAMINKTSPKIEGIASDNSQLARIDYSVDGGRNWLIVDTVTGLGSSRARFSFTPINLKDDNYSLVLRAIDSSGNQTSSSPLTFVIDSLPPLVGSVVMTVGTQILQPNNQGNIDILTAVDQKITLNAVGGPTSITVVESMIGSDKAIQTFSLARSTDNNLWSGVLSYSSAGIFQLTVKAIDGAGNVTKRLLNNVNVSESGKVVNEQGEQLNAVVTVYVIDPDTGTWVVWDGESYDQPNPANTSNKKGYGLYLPTGKYYLKVTSSGRRTIITKSFTLDKPTVINQKFTLSSNPGFDIGWLHLHLLWPKLVDNYNLGSNHLKKGYNLPIINQSMPQFKLAQTDGGLLTTNKLYGKPTILSIVSSWSSSSIDELGYLSELPSQSINIVALSPGESLSSLSSFVNIVNYPFAITADSNNQLSDGLGVTSSPSTYFIDRHGVVKKLMFGVLSKQELLDNVIF